MTPACPPHYDCTFRLKDPPHYYAHWWDGPYGIAVAAAALVVLLVLVLVITEAVKKARYEHRMALERRDEKLREVTEKREVRAQELAVEEQRTMQLDAAKGDPDMLRIVRDMQRTPR